MPEGDTIHRTANVLRRALAGRIVTAFEVVAPRMSSDAARFAVIGSVVRAVESNGKHLRITFARGDDDVVLHTHMKMTGAWHVYRPGERWWSPRSDARGVVTTDEFVAPCLRPPAVEMMTTRAIAWGYHPNEFRKSWYCPKCQNVEWAPTTAEALARLRA